MGRKNVEMLDCEYNYIMRYDIVLTKTPGNGFIARPLLWPDVVASGRDETEALAGVREALIDVLAQSRIVQIDLPAQHETEEDPWLHFAGMWQDVPEEDWERFQSAVTAVRQSANQTTDASHDDATS